MHIRAHVCSFFYLISSYIHVQNCMFTLHPAPRGPSSSPTVSLPEVWHESARNRDPSLCSRWKGHKGSKQLCHFYPWAISLLPTKWQCAVASLYVCAAGNMQCHWLKPLPVDTDSGFPQCKWLMFFFSREHFNMPDSHTSTCTNASATNLQMHRDGLM